MKLPIFLTWNHWKNCKQWKAGIRASCYFYTFYAWIWGIIASLSHHIPAFENWSKGNTQFLITIAIIGFLIGIGRSLHECAKMLSVREKIENADISIEIKIGNIFDIKGDFIIGTNTTFKTIISNDNNSEGSLQEQITRKFYNRPEELDLELKDALEIEGENKKNTESYKFGTVAKVAPQNQIIYFVVLDQLNTRGGASSSLENIRQSLKALWQHISNESKRDHLVIPVIGTRYSGIPVPRATMITEIIKSFINATYSEKHICQKLTIVISENDYKQQDINLQELGEYLHVHATQKKWEIQEPVGQSIPDS